MFNYLSKFSILQTVSNITYSVVHSHEKFDPDNLSKDKNNNANIVFSFKTRLKLKQFYILYMATDLNQQIKILHRNKRGCHMLNVYSFQNPIFRKNLLDMFIISFFETFRRILG